MAEPNNSTRDLSHLESSSTAQDVSNIQATSTVSKRKHHGNLEIARKVLGQHDKLHQEDSDKPKISPFNMAGSISSLKEEGALTSEQWHAHARLAAERLSDEAEEEGFGLVEDLDDLDSFDDVVPEEGPTGSNTTKYFAPIPSKQHPYERGGRLYSEESNGDSFNNLHLESEVAANTQRDIPRRIGQTDEPIRYQDSTNADSANTSDGDSESTSKGSIELERPEGARSHSTPKKELCENVRHGTSVFPFASYVWTPQSYPSRVTLHWHREMELVRFEKGTFNISIDMQDTEIHDNAFLLLPSNVMHTFTLPANCIESAIVFDAKMLALQSYDEVQSEIFEPLVSGNIPLPPVITPEHPAFAKIDSLYRYCARHGATTNASRRLIIKSKLLEILSIYHEYGLISRKDVHCTLKRSKQDKLKELLNYIDTHYAGPMSIKDASSRLGVTDQYFCRFFKRVTGMSFTEYLNDLRLRRAAKEIELTSRAISDIAFEHGFENAGYFFKSFKQKFGITPLKYRKRHHLELKAQEALKIAQTNSTGTILSSTDIEDHSMRSELATFMPTKNPYHRGDDDSKSTEELFSNAFGGTSSSFDSQQSRSYIPRDVGDMQSDLNDDYLSTRRGLIELNKHAVEDVELEDEPDNFDFDQEPEDSKAVKAKRAPRRSGSTAERRPRAKMVAEDEQGTTVTHSDALSRLQQLAGVKPPVKERHPKLGNMPPLNMDTMHKISPQAARRARIEELERLSRQKDPFDL